MPNTKSPKPRASMTTSHMTNAPCRACFDAQPAHVFGKAAGDRSIGSPTAARALPVSVTVKCHPAHRFSRRANNKSYRNFIKARRPLAPREGPERHPHRATAPGDAFMRSLFLGLPTHLVFKWRFGHLDTWQLL